MERLRVSAAAKRLSIHPDTLRRWCDEGKVEYTTFGRERRFDSRMIDEMLGETPVAPTRREALYVRVSGSAGQETSLEAQETLLRDTATGEVVAVFKDRASGLNEKRTGLTRLLKRAEKGEFTVVRVTHEDRLARFGVSWIETVLSYHNVTVEVLNEKQTIDAKDELLADFMSLVASFSGRLYGLRSREMRKQLLSQANNHIGETGDAE